MAKSLLNTAAFLVIFQAISSVMTKGVLRSGGDTKFLMLADVFYLWTASIPLDIVQVLYGTGHLL